MSARRVVYARQGSAKLHVLAESRGYVVPLGLCGVQLHGDDYLARLVPVDERCQAPGCRAAWPAALRAVS